MAEPEAEVTEDQANELLHQVMGIEGEPTAEPTAAELPTQDVGTAQVAPEGKEVAAEETPAEGEPVAEVEPEVEAAPADDVESLLARNKKLEEAAEEAEKRGTARLEALKQRGQQSDQIMRDRLLRKSTLSDKMAQTLRKSRSADGVPEAEVDQVIREFEGSLNPASASYVAPQPAAVDNDDQVLVLNQFLDEKGMDLKESDQFGEWVKTKAGTVMSQQEQDVARESLGGFLRLAHFRWQTETKQKAADAEAKRSDAVNTARSVKRTQREAAKAASPTIAAPKKQPGTQAKEPSVDDMTENEVSELLKAATRQYI